MSGACTRQTTDNCTSYTDDPSSAKHFHNSGSYSSHQPNPYEILLRSAPYTAPCPTKPLTPNFCSLTHASLLQIAAEDGLVHPGEGSSPPHCSAGDPAQQEHRGQWPCPINLHSFRRPHRRPGRRSGRAAHHGRLHRVALHPAAVRAGVLLLVMGRGIRAWAAMACGMCWKVRTA